MQVSMVRCKNCNNCITVEESRRLFMPNPPFSHATTSGVKAWNKVVVDNPCEQWGERQMEQFEQQTKELQEKDLIS